jgi:hypothetical protein
MDYINDTREILQRARSKFLQVINSAMVEAYWHVGKRILEQVQEGAQRAKCIEAILKDLALNLTREFGKGFSEAKLRNFRQFFLTYPDFQICYTLCSELYTEKESIHTENIKDYFVFALTSSKQNDISNYLEVNTQQIKD